MVQLLCCNLPEQALSFTNKAYVNPNTLRVLTGKDGVRMIRCTVGSLILNLEGDKRIEEGQIGLNKFHRTHLRAQTKAPVHVEVYKPAAGQNIQCGLLEVEVDTHFKNEQASFTDEDLEKEFKAIFTGHVITQGQEMAADWEGTIIILRAKNIQALDLGAKGGEPEKRAKKKAPTPMDFGFLSNETEYSFTSVDDSRVSIQTKKAVQRTIFRPDFDFSALGIGGLDKEFADIFRRAFASRIFPSVVQELGINHVRGMLLFGPPGTGKTLIARQIGKMLKAREPKIVNGPEVLNKYVGQAEENIRNLFKEAEDEQKKSGANSALHIIIFDEMDAICKQRGSGVHAGTGDSIVNQLLSKIDGVEALNNILLIGMTNRMDLIDEALLRPGRLEVHVEVGLPDEEGRVQILNIHTRKMRDSGRMDEDVSIPTLAARTKNFSGAEIEGLVRSAASHAFNKGVNVRDLGKPSDISQLKIGMAEFELALEEVKPAFGVQEETIEAAMPWGIIPFSDDFMKTKHTLLTLVNQVKNSESTRTLSVLLEGAHGSGKSALAAHIAKTASFPFVKIISPDKFVNYSEMAKVSSIAKTFDDAYKSQLSLIVLDDIERLLEFTRVGLRFSNHILQALIVLAKKAPPPGRRLLVVGTTSERPFLQEAGGAAAFNVHLSVPLVEGEDDVKAILTHRQRERHDFPEEQIQMVAKALLEPLGIKHLLQTCEMAAEVCRPGTITCDAFLDCLRDCGHQ